MLSLKNLCFSYKSKQLLINDIDYTFSTGIYFITGKNGCGKTTLLRLMAGILEPQRGEILINQQKQDLFKNVNMLDYQNIDFLNAAKVQTLINILIGVNPAAQELMKEVVEKLEIDVNEKIAKLSKGNIRKVMLLPMFATDRKYLLLDEPFDNLDIEMVEKLFLLLQELSKDKTIIIVSHIRNNLFCDVPTLNLAAGRLTPC